MREIPITSCSKTDCPGWLLTLVVLIHVYSRDINKYIAAIRSAIKQTGKKKKVLHHEKESYVNLIHNYSRHNPRQLSIENILVAGDLK